VLGFKLPFYRAPTFLVSLGLSVRVFWHLVMARPHIIHASTPGHVFFVFLLRSHPSPPLACSTAWSPHPPCALSIYRSSDRQRPLAYGSHTVFSSPVSPSATVPPALLPRSLTPTRPARQLRLGESEPSQQLIAARKCEEPLAVRSRRDCMQTRPFGLPTVYPIYTNAHHVYPILSYPILSYPILSYPILSYPILWSILSTQVSIMSPTTSSIPGIQCLHYLRETDRP
jgi:hypothetical protein